MVGDLHVARRRDGIHRVSATATTEGGRATSPTETATPAPSPRWRAAAAWLVLILAIAALVWAGVWRLTGGHWERIETPSMGTAAPVGTLLWVEPVPFDSIRVGDFVTFHPPNSPHTYSHRVHTVNADGTLTTKGDVNGATDPWQLHASDVVGTVTMRWWGIGWLVKAAPLLIIGGLALWLLVRYFTAPRWKPPAVIVGVALVLSLAIYVYRPLVGAEMISFVPAQQGGRATYISTGLLPTRLQAPQDGHVDLSDGQVGTILSTHADAHGRYWVTLTPNITWWWWLVLVLVCFIPALWTLIVGLPGKPQPHTAAD